jgi:hypothetical protein
MDVLVATDFFTAEVWTKAGLVTYNVLFLIHLASRKVHVAGVMPHESFDCTAAFRIASGWRYNSWWEMTSTVLAAYATSGMSFSGFCPW